VRPRLSSDSRRSAHRRRGGESESESAKGLFTRGFNSHLSARARSQYTGGVTTSEAKNVAGDAKNSPALQTLARVGFAVLGLLHLLIGAIAINIAVGSGGGKADQSGALGQLASNPAGSVILWVIVAGLFALGVWMLLSALLMPGSDPKRKWMNRISDVSKAIVYFAIGGTALTFALGGSADSSSSSSSASAQLLAAPGGVVLLTLVGAIVVVIGGYFIYKGASRAFTEELTVPAGKAGRATIAVGMTGYIAKGVSLMVVGILIIGAAITADPTKSSGLDGALKALAGLPFGVVILLAVGAGLIAYGAYCFVRARRARL
jgi:hypothetical protein